MARVPVIRVGETLIATVQEDLRDRDALELQETLNQTLEDTGARGVLLDLSGVDTIDSFLGRLLNELAQGARLMGAQTVVVGIQPAVAVTLVELGLELRGVRTALNADKGMLLRRRLLAHTDANRFGLRTADNGTHSAVRASGEA
jgi:rsbT antagonist protein RsbS